MAKCYRCGRKLKNPKSIAMGLGPECASNSSGSPPLKNWIRKVNNSIQIMNNRSFNVNNELTINSENYNELKPWLLKYNYILRDGDISNEILDEISKNPDKFFGGNTGE